MSKTYCVRMLTLAAALLLIEAPPAAFAEGFFLSPASQTVPLGNQASVDLVFSSTPPALSSYIVFIEYDPSILSANDLTFSFALGPPGPGFQFIFDYGLISIYAEGSRLGPAELLENQDPSLGPNVLASILFDTIGTGTSGLALTYSLALDQNRDPLFPTTTDGSITVSGIAAVPEPGTWLLTGLGMALFTILFRRRPTVS